MIIGTLPRFGDNKDENNPWRYSVAGSFGTTSARVNSMHGWVIDKYTDPREKKLFENFLALCKERKQK